jgi:lipopolysaccharide transport system ATP-binding protein
MTPAVTFEHVWKRFRRGERHNSLRDLVPSLARRAVRGAERADHQDFWAVRDVSFEVASGEALGIIGPNGAGKSTVLKLLTRILKPTRGVCSVRGRVGALIEVAAGFHPDLTGRENVFLQGAIMGMKRPEIVRKLDAIVDFAGIDEFIDTPVKRYSSGMNARLGFSIAAHLDPDVLIIDEVLAVGDAAFQEKCRKRMTEFRRNGVAIVFVSHNLQAVTELCTQGVFLDKGSVQAAGAPSDAIGRYCQGTRRTDESSPLVTSLVIDGLKRLVTSDAELLTVVPGTTISLQAELTSPVSVREAVIGVAVWDTVRSGYCYVSTSHLTGAEPFDIAAGQRVRVKCRIAAHLAKGIYQLQLNIFDLARQDSVCGPFTVQVFSVDESSTHQGSGNAYLYLRTDSLELVTAVATPLEKAAV